MKIPKSMGACADLLYDTRQKRLTAEKAAAELKVQEQELKLHIIDTLAKDTTGAAGKHHRVQVVRKWKPRIDPTKWDKFFGWVSKNRRFDLLQKRISDTAVAELVETLPKSKLPPGVEKFDYVDVSLTKI